jgi:hypothetical protein
MSCCCNCGVTTSSYTTTEIPTANMLSGFGIGAGVGSECECRRFVRCSTRSTWRRASSFGTNDGVPIGNSMQQMPPTQPFMQELPTYQRSRLSRWDMVTMVKAHLLHPLGANSTAQPPHHSTFMHPQQRQQTLFHDPLYYSEYDRCSYGSAIV